MHILKLEKECAVLPTCFLDNRSCDRSQAGCGELCCGTETVAAEDRALICSQHALVRWLAHSDHEKYVSHYSLECVRVQD